MSFTAEQKSQLAKLLATENLTVQHQKISTAKFDIKNRVLYLPIWQNMTGVIYDLLVGHEVGHALYTPADGWHDAVSDTDKNKNYKSFLNVIEDARIEKKIKRKYPGLNASFRNAYQELNNRDFFGIRGRDVNAMPFIDRLNLFSKSQWSATWIEFTAQEESLVKEVQSAETWSDVVRIADKVYAYSKEEQFEMQLEQYADPEFGENGSDDDSFGEEGSDMDSFGDDDSFGEKGENDSDIEKPVKSKSSQSKDGEDSEGQNEFDEGQSINHDKETSRGTKDQFNPDCETDRNYRKNEFKLLDEKCKEFDYLQIPQPILKNIVTPAKRVQELMTKYYNEKIADEELSPQLVSKLVSDFKNRNERYVGLLAKEFEMRKAAKSFSKSKLSDTGDIDVNKLSSYKFDDNIFRKVMITPKGKNHGLVLLLDRSGSMSNNMAGSIEQILVLSMFCRKVNIPFVVYGFTECGDVRMLDLGLNSYESRSKFMNQYYYGDGRCFTNNINEMVYENVNLREYLNSQMTNAEFSNAIRNMCLLMESYKREHKIRRYFPRPDTEQLHNTPMIQAIVATAEIMKEFKRKNNLDICSLVVVHDGDADYISRYNTEMDFKDPNTGVISRKKTTAHIQYGEKNIVMRDTKNKFEVNLSNYNNVRDALAIATLDWFRKVTGARIFGFFIVPSGYNNVKYAISSRYLFEDGKSFDQIKNNIGYVAAEEKVKLLSKQFKSEKYLASVLPGYENFFLIHGGSELTTEDEDFEVEGNFTVRKLASAFAKYNKKRAVNRVLVSRFIQGIAA